MALKGVLPNFIVENRKIYSFLSKGIHELSEEDCAKMFPTLRASILMIAEQEREIREKQLAEDQLKGAIAGMGALIAPK
ncbi:hypothetical protein [Maricaulis sp.]|uniref:hypothetical protein n=1 Tax=Maricaulis sp. TaxID=1486257 RepID=UPI003A94EE7F